MGSQVERNASIAEKEEIYSRKHFNQHLIAEKERKQVDQKRIMIQAKLHRGIGNCPGGLTDQFVITRKINSPELIWNQNRHKDQNKKTRYFEVGAAALWQLS